MINRFDVTITYNNGKIVEYNNLMGYQLLEQGGVMVLTSESTELCTEGKEGKKLMRAHKRDSYWIKMSEVKAMDITHINYPENKEDRTQLNKMSSDAHFVSENVGTIENVAGKGSQVVEIQ